MRTKMVKREYINSRERERKEKLGNKFSPQIKS
jgi:hypothetical protein